MLVNKEKLKISVPELVSVLLSFAFLIGIRSWFGVCPVSGEMVMSCHWAGEVLKSISILMVVITLIRLFLPDEKIKMGMNLAFLCVLILTIFLPGGVISLCQDAGMQCRSQTQPWAVILVVALILVTVIDEIIYVSAITKQKHQRKESA